ncbi:hypothetical protein [uncultured Polaribacter sp.]|uniref:hypothetical protein n=1 Tax=uncultured Polaribacter sp. TaxID=174711 RepID=UPI0026246E88|nr:hypothetical protein [uncultured Polaribacter sp.]
MKEYFIDIEADYKQTVKQIWKDFENSNIFSDAEKEYRRYPLLPEKVYKNKLLFIGINPSFTKGSTIPEKDKNNDIGFYSEQLDQSKKDIPYFEKIKEVANFCKTEWTHLDLFFLRETNQKIIEKLSLENIEFLNAQLRISFEIIEKSEPKLIIVSNAFASEFFGKMKAKHHLLNNIWRSFDLFFYNDERKNKKSTFNYEIGTYEIELNNKKIPIIFSGMLSGQRALDIGSLERLKWQSKMILEGKKMK